MKKYIPVIIIILTVLLSKHCLQEAFDPGFYERQQKVELFYLPSVEASRIMCFGFNNLYADYLFINSIVYFMDHFKGDKDYEYLQHQFDIIVELDPYFTKAYTFGALAFFIAFNNLEKPVSFLLKAYRHMPANWRLIQEIAFYYYQFRDYKNASEWYLKASELEGLPASMKNRFLQLHYSSLELTGEFDKARYLWFDLYLNAEDNVTKELAARRLFLIFDLENIKNINYALDIYKSMHGRNPQSLAELQRQEYSNFQLYNELYPDKKYIYSALWGNILLDQMFLEEYTEYNVPADFKLLYPFYLFPEMDDLHKYIGIYLAERSGK